MVQLPRLNVRDWRVWVVALAIVLLLVGGTVVVVKGTETEEKRKAQLLPQVRAALDRVQADLLAQGVRTFVGSTKRTDEEQAKILAAGNSATSHSWHLLGRAIDLYPYDPDTGKPDLPGKRLELFRLLHAVAAKHGFRGLAFNPDGSKRYITGSKGKVWDGGHIEYPEGLTWAQSAAQQGVA